MKKIKISLLLFAWLTTFCSCTEVMQHDISIILSQPLSDDNLNSFRRDMGEIAVPYICGDSIMNIPYINLYRIDSLQISQRLTYRLENTISGDSTNANRAQRKLREQIFRFKPNYGMTGKVTIQEKHIKLLYSTIFRRYEKDNIILLSDDDFDLDSIPNSANVSLVHNTLGLKNKIEEILCNEEQEGKRIKVLYRPVPPKNIFEEPLDLVKKNEVAVEKNDRDKLKEIGEKLEARLERNPLEWRLWYELAINRIKLGGAKYLRDGIEFLRNAARESIDQDEGQDLLRLLETKKGFITRKYKYSKIPRHPIAVYDALKRNEKCILDVITATVIKENWHTIGKNTVNLVPVQLYRNSYWGFRIIVKEKFTDGSLLLDMFIPNKEGVIEKLDFKMRLGQEYRTVLSNKKIDDNQGVEDGEWEFVFINESPLDCSNAKIRYDINLIEQ